MVHYGKHIIDPQTGLCEICDRGAIHELKHGKRPGKQFLYSNHDGKFTYRPNNNENYPPQEQQTPRYVRKPLYPEPPPSIRSRQPVHEEPLTQRRIPRRAHSPVVVDDPHPRLATLYYVDGFGQMYPQNNGPTHESRPVQPMQNYQQPRPNLTRTIQRRARTPPPPASDTWRSPPKRQNKSDTEILPQQSLRVRPNDAYYEQSPRKVEMFYIERPHDRFTTLNALVPPSYEDRTPPLRNAHQAANNRKPRQLEPVEQKYRPEPEQTFVKKVYRKLPTNRSEPREDEYVPNEYYPQTARKVEKYYPSPPLTNRQNQTYLPNKFPSAYHIQSEYVY